MEPLPGLSATFLLWHLALSGVVGAVIGYERQLRHKAIGVAGMMLVAMGSTTYMLLARHMSTMDPQALGRAVQGILSGIGFLGGAVIFKGGTDVRGIKTAAAIWITGAVGFAIGIDLWSLGVTVGVATAVILFIADLAPHTPVTHGTGDDAADQS